MGTRWRWLGRPDAHVAAATTRPRLPGGLESARRAGELAAPFIDYLYLGFTNATAFSPTDVKPIAPWAKIAMAVQAVVSIAILGLVIARAVNVFT